MILWSVSVSMTYRPVPGGSLLIWANLVYCAGVLIPSTFMLTSFVFPDARISRKEWILSGTVALVCLSLVITFLTTPLMISSVQQTAGVTIYHFGPLKYAWYVFFNLFFWVGLSRYYAIFKISEGQKKNALAYVLSSVVAGYLLAGVTNVWMIWFGYFHWNWVGPVICVPSLCFITYALLRYHLLDIRQAFLKISILLFVYCVGLGLPMLSVVYSKEALSARLGDYWLWTPMAVMFVLGSGSPLAYLYLKRKAENVLFHSKKHALQDLLNSADKLVRIRDPLEVETFLREMIQHFLNVPECQLYLALKSPHRYARVSNRDRVIEIREQLEPFFKQSAFQRHNLDPADEEDREIQEMLKSLGAALVVPCVHNNKVQGVMTIGAVNDKFLFTSDEMTVLMLLGNQVGLALDSINAYEQEQEQIALIYQSTTLSRLGVMADAMGHQIRNHIQKMMSLAGSEAGMIEIPEAALSPEDERRIHERHLRALRRIEELGEKGSELLTQIRKYSRLSQSSFEETGLHEVWETAWQIFSFRKTIPIRYTIDIPCDLPPVSAHPILSEVIVNLLHNAADAVQRRAEILAHDDPEAAAGYSGEIGVNASVSVDGSLSLKIRDNGVGMGECQMQNLFVPFYTTKPTSEKFSYIGMHIIRKIMQHHQGGISVESQVNQGTCVTLSFNQKVAREKSGDA